MYALVNIRRDDDDDDNNNDDGDDDDDDDNKNSEACNAPIPIRTRQLKSQFKDSAAMHENRCCT